MKQDSRGAKKVRQQLTSHLPPDETIEYVSVATVKPDAGQLTGELVTSVLRGGQGAVLPMRRAAVVLTSSNLLVIIVDVHGKLLTDQTYIFPRDRVAVVNDGGAFGMKQQIVDAAGRIQMKITFPLPNREDGRIIASLVGPAMT